MSTLSNPASEATDHHTRLDALLIKLRSELADVDCRCRDEVDKRLDQIAAQGTLDGFRNAMEQARNMRDSIVTLLAFLAELDELGLDENDLGSFGEAAGLFDDINQASATGAAAVRRALFLHPANAR